jgi:hypothetical protein
VIALLIPGIVAAVLAAVGIGANWWFQFFDWQQLGTVAIPTVICCVTLAVITSPGTRMLAGVAMALGFYVLGALDRQAQLYEQFAETERRIHDGYAKAAMAERARQQEANLKAQQEAAASKEEHDNLSAVLRQQLADINIKAVNDVHAKACGLSSDAVRNLDSLRMFGRPGS